jgi:hypothetical protein
MGPVMLALGGTAATTLLVAALWPRRWPYLLMFSAWLGCSALVYHSPVPPTDRPRLTSKFTDGSIRSSQVCVTVSERQRNSAA